MQVLSFGRNITEDKLHSSHCILSSSPRCHLVPLMMFIVITWLRWCLPSFFTVELLFIFVVNKNLWKGTLKLSKLVPYQTFNISNYWLLLGRPQGFLVYSVGYNSLLSVFILMHKLSWIWPVGAPSSWFLCPLQVSSLFLEHCLTFWCSKMFQAHSITFPPPTPESVISPRSPGSFWWRMVFRTHSKFASHLGPPRMVFRHQDVGTRCPHCYRYIISSRPAERT